MSVSKRNSKAVAPKPKDPSSDDDIDFAEQFAQAVLEHCLWMKPGTIAEIILEEWEGAIKVQFYFLPEQATRAASGFEAGKFDIFFKPLFGLVVPEHGAPVKLPRAKIEELLRGAESLVVAESEWRTLDPSKPVNRLVINLK
jgi:hypothetical protein